MPMETYRADAVTPRAQSAPSLLSVVCPAFNEADALEAFYDELSAVMGELVQPYEVVFVNDGSTDKTLSVMGALREKHPNTAIVDLSRNFGKEIALAAGLDVARGDAVVVIDADLQDPPGLIGAFIKGWSEGYDVVYARRRIREGEGWLKKATAALFYRVMRNVGPVPLPENVGDFRLMSRKAVDAVCSMRERHRFMKGVFAWVGFPAKCVEYDRAARSAGTTKWDYFKLWNLSLEGLTSSTLAPLKLSTYLGFIVALLSFAYGSFIIIKALLFGDPAPGFPTLAALVLFLGGIQLIVLGVIGEYLGRVFNETKNRPLYFTNNFLPSNIRSEMAEKKEVSATGGPAA
jgi:glycosyltransferase involved in cell wall biosynthesis